MKHLPKGLHVNNITNFRKDYIARAECYFRRDIYEHVLISDENNYFTLEDFRLKFKLTSSDMEILTTNIISELSTLGWKCKTSYNDTALFIYSTEDPPPLCYPDGF